MAQLIQTVDRTSREMRLSRERSEREMQEFKEEMRLFHERSDERSKREMQEFKEEMRRSHEHSDERSKREMQEFKEEMRQSKRDLDKKWGELSNKLGTMAEDLVAPSIPRILKQVTGCTEGIDSIAVRVKKRKPRDQEFDVVAVCDKWVFINETKSHLRSENMSHFHELMQKIHDYFPEFAEKQFIGAIASLYVDEKLVGYGEKLGLIVLGFGEELMDVLNAPGFVPKLF
jgi:hypothetical protein